MLPARTVLFTAFQALLAAGFLLAGSSSAWADAANWWPFIVTMANLVCIALLIGLYRGEGKSFWGIFRLQRPFIKSDLLVMLAVLIIFGPVAYLPNLLLGAWLFGDMQIPNSMFIRPLPAWAAIASLLIWPVTQGMAELPTYFGYAMPRLEEQTRRPWLALSLSAIFLAIQHLAVPLLPDARFLAWRALMFLPFAFLVGILLHWRPRLMPYFAIVYILIDAATAATLLTVMQ